MVYAHAGNDAHFPALVPGHFGHAFDGLEAGVHPYVVDVGLEPAGQGGGRGGGAGDVAVGGPGGGDALGRHAVYGQLLAGVGLGRGLLGKAHAVADEIEHIFGRLALVQNGSGHGRSCGQNYGQSQQHSQGAILITPFHILYPPIGKRCQKGGPARGWNRRQTVFKPPA